VPMRDKSKHPRHKGHPKHKRKHKHATSVKTRRHRLHKPPVHKLTGSEQAPMSEAMVDRLFWRAGFGPSAANRSTWTGRSVGDAVDWMLGTPAAFGGVQGTDSGSALDPTGNDTDLVLNWVDQMVRSTNPFIERLTFFWHRHFANSREQVSPPQLMMTQTQLFRTYSDFALNPSATFKNLAYAVTIDPSMLRYLTGELNVRGAPNENYAREVMELFTLGVLNAAGQPNYSQTDVEQLAKAFSGWQINDTNPDAAHSYFSQSRWYDGPKLVFGEFSNFNSQTAVDLVLSRPAHPAFLITELWGEFMATPPPASTLAKLVSTYTSSGFQLKPLLRQMLTDPALFASIAEPNKIKPPVVVMRALGLGVTDSTANDYLDAMGELPYFPPNVSGWEGGLSWLNTDTALARFGFVSALLAKLKISDVPGETPAAAFERAYVAVGAPWIATGTASAIQNYANSANAATVSERLQRQIALRALFLAGPDAQVM
jgi:uncharacterized protein (DUF1800 family)